MPGKKEKGDMTMNNPNDVNEVYGDGMGKSGNGAEQTEVAKNSLRYQRSFQI